MVKNLPNPTIETLPFIGPNAGFWAEVTIPYVDLVQANPPPRSPWLSQAAHPRLYYSQVVWIDDLRKGSQGQMLYRVNERYGSYGDVFWATGEAFRPITVEEVSPINPDAQNKKIVVDVNHQTLVCYEGNQEVYYCQVSTGALYDRNGTRVEEWATPPGPHPISRKLVSIHMAGGGLDTGWDTPGIGWTSLFSEGAAIHSTFWHNAFGTPKSHGCVNCKPEDSKWIFRWTMPIVTYEPGDITVQMPGGTVVDVVY
jgi:lipoprotein-anchoring transpeptidase ErfK/SrfK